MVDLPPDLDVASLRRLLTAGFASSTDDGERAVLWRRREAEAEHLVAARDARATAGDPEPPARLHLPAPSTPPAVDDAPTREAVERLGEIPSFAGLTGARRWLARVVAGSVLSLARFFVDAVQRLLLGLVERQADERHALGELVAAIERLNHAVGQIVVRLDALESSARIAAGERLDQRVELASLRADQAYLEAVADRLHDDLAGGDEPPVD